MSKRILLVTYYWPPSGGPGVQRWLKMTHYLAEMGCEITVLTVDPKVAAYPHQDMHLLSDVHPSIEVVRTNAFNPFAFTQWWGKSKSQKGIANFSVPKNGGVKFRALAFVRSHLFIPDPRKGWNRYAIKEARRLLTERRYDVLLTTSPPHSSQLIGLQLKSEFGIRWVTDFRDPWTDIFYYHHLGHSAWSRKLDLRLEKRVISECDGLITVGHQLRNCFAQKYPGQAAKMGVVHNGYDERDFEPAKVSREEMLVSSQGLNMTYTGTLSNLYHYEPLFEAVASFLESDDSARCDIFGRIPSDIADDLKNQSNRIFLQGEIRHDEITKKQVEADVLLLLIADVENADLIVSGKIFEYLRSGNPIICLGPKHGEAAKVISECEAGQTFERHEVSAIKAYIEQLADNKRKGIRHHSNHTKVSTYSRENLAGKAFELL